MSQIIDFISHSKYSKSLRGVAMRILLLLIAVYIYQYMIKVSGQIDFSFGDLSKVIQKNPVLIFLLVILSPVNSLIEAKKWQTALHSIIPGLTVKEALKMIYAGAAAGLITPSKLGEYGGRMVGISLNNIPGALIANFYCSMAQNLVNLLAGFAGILFINQLLYSKYPFLTMSFITMAGISALVLVLVFYHLDYFIKRGMNTTFFNKYLSQIQVDKLPDLNKDKILHQSFLRYSVYLIQYLLVVQILGFQAGLVEKISAIGIIFFLQSVVILPSLMGFVARVEIAFFVWSVAGIVQGEVLLAAFFLWLVNLALPAVIGGLWLLIENKSKLDEKVG